MKTLRLNLSLLATATLGGCVADLNIGDKPTEQLGSSDDGSTSAPSTDDDASGPATTGTDDDSTGAPDEAPPCELLGPGPGADPRFEWSLHCGGLANEALAGLALGDDGSIYLAINFYSDTLGPAPFALGDDVLGNEGFGDVVLAKIDAAGTLVWSRHFGAGGANVWAGSLAFCDGRLVLAGGNDDQVEAGIDFGDGPLDGTSFVAGFDADGNTVWARDYGTHGTFPPTAEVACGDAGEVAVFGHFGGTIDVGGDELSGSTVDGADAYVAVFEADGAHRWSRAFGDDAAQSIEAAVFTADGTLVTASTVWGSTDFGGGAIDSDDGDVVIAAFDVAGDFAWQHVTTGSGLRLVRQLVVDGDGAITMLGGFDDEIDLGGGVLDNQDPEPPPDFGGQAKYDLFVAALDAAGTHQWSARTGSVGVDAVVGLTLGAGDLPIASWSDDAANLHVAAMAGGIEAGVLATSGGRMLGAQVEADSAGAMVVGASTLDPVDLGGGAIAIRGDTDLLITRFGP